MTDDLIVYSATFGGYDVVPPLPATSSYERVMFTDNPDLIAPEWNIEVLKAVPGEHPRRAAKTLKLFPSLYVPGYERRVWMDASTMLVDPQAPLLALECLNESGLAMFAHPDRDCIYDEAVECMTMEKYQGQPIPEQVAHYRRHRHPEHWGLWAMTVMASTPAADELLEETHREVVEWSTMDQIPLPVVCRRHRVRPGAFPHRQTASPWWVGPGPHTRDD